MRLLSHLAVLLLGAAVGTAAALVHRSLPGIVLGIGTTLVVAVALRQWRRPLTATYALGWLVTVGSATFGRGEGDYAVATDGYGYALLVTALVVLVLGAGSLGTHDSGSGAPRT
jgi:hypothetical protein